MKMQSAIALLLAVTMLASLVGCATDPQSDEQPTTTTAETTTTTAEATVESTTSAKETDATQKGETTTTVTTTTATTADAHEGHNHTTTANPHEGHNHTTTTSKAGESGSSLKFDEIVTLTLENKIPANSRVYQDKSAGEPNYTLKLTAETDLAQIQLISLNPETGSPEAVLTTLPALKKGNSQYILTYVNDANPNRGIVCTDRQGVKWYYSFLHSGQSGRVYLGYFEPKT